MNGVLEIVLRNSKDQVTSAYFSVANNTIGKKWFQFLEKTLLNPHHLEKSYTFLGFLGSKRNLEFLAQELNSVSEKISNYLGEGPWKHGYPIQEKLDPLHFKAETLHALHHHFEILIGQAWAVSPYYSCASDEMRITIHHLNYLIHEIEALLHSKAQFQETGSYYPYMIVSFPDSKTKPRLFDDEDYSYFSLNRPFGSLTLHYAQTGKPFFDAWRDKDEKIGKSNVNSLRYLSGQFDVNWGDGPDCSNEKLKTMYSDFFQWLENQGYKMENHSYFIDENGQKQGVGFIEVARLRTDQRDLGIRHWQDLLGEYNDIYSLRLHSENGIVEKTYPEKR